MTVKDILTVINNYGGDNSFSSGIILLRYITVDIQMFLDMLQLLKGDMIIFMKLRRFILINLVKDCCWSLIIWISQISPPIISPIRKFILSCTHLLCTSWLPFPYIHQIIHLLFHTLSLLTKSLLVELTQLCSRGLARQIYKTNNSVSFWDFLTR